MFVNREDAGAKLALRLSGVFKLSNLMVIAIPRGGIIVGKVVAKTLGTALHALIVKKIGAPQNPELAIGAVGPNSIVYWDKKLIESLGVEKEKEKLLGKTMLALKESKKRLKLKSPNVKDKTVIVVDDGVATGATTVVSAIILKKMGAKKIILATPVITKHTKLEIGHYFDKIISVLTPQDLHAVGEFYHDFPQVEDEEVRALLRHN